MFYNVYIHLSNKKIVGWKFYGHTMYEIISGIVKYPSLYDIPDGVTVTRVNFYRISKSMSRLN